MGFDLHIYGSLHQHIDWDAIGGIGTLVVAILQWRQNRRKPRG